MVSAVSAVGGINPTAATLASFGALLIYDVFFVTFGREVTLIWPTRWNVIKVLFFFNRYLPFVDTSLSLYFLLGKDTIFGCVRAFAMITWLTGAGYLISEIILMIRTFAVWGCTRTIRFVLIFIGVATFVPAIIIAQLAITTLEYKSSADGTCIEARASSRLSVATYLLFEVCETTIVALTIVQARRHCLTGQVRSPLISQLYKDGLLYFVYLQVFSAINIVVSLAGPPEIADFLSTPQRVIHSLLCTRVLLHIRANDKAHSEEIATAQVSLDFAENSLASSTDQSDPEMAPESSGDNADSEHLESMDIKNAADRGENGLEKRCKEGGLRAMQP